MFLFNGFYGKTDCLRVHGPGHHAALWFNIKRGNRSQRLKSVSHTLQQVHFLLRCTCCFIVTNSRLDCHCVSSRTTFLALTEQMQKSKLWQSHSIRTRSNVICSPETNGPEVRDSAGGKCAPSMNHALRVFSAVQFLLYMFIDKNIMNEGFRKE